MEVFGHIRDAGRVSWHAVWLRRNGRRVGVDGIGVGRGGAVVQRAEQNNRRS